MAEKLQAAEAELGRIDAVAGDGDHGRGMVNGVTAALDAAISAADRGAGAESVLAAAGDAWAAKAGGTSGVLWGAALRAVGSHLGDQGEQPSTTAVAAAVRAGMAEIRRLGKAEAGDKTMLDALAPFVDALDAALGAGRPLPQAWADAAEVSGRAAQQTAALRPRVGRARPLADKSVGTPDAGAISMAMCLGAVAGQLSTKRQ
jgi:dihydroxyacetone kinase